MRSHCEYNSAMWNVCDVERWAPVPVIHHTCLDIFKCMRLWACDLALVGGFNWKSTEQLECHGQFANLAVMEDGGCSECVFGDAL